MISEILYVTNARIPTEKAHGLQIIKTIDALVREGITVTLVVPKRANHIEENAHAFYGVNTSFKVVYLPDPFFFVEPIFQDLYFAVNKIRFGVEAFFYTLLRKEKIVYTRNITLAFFLSLFTAKCIVFEDHEPKLSKRTLYAFFLRYIDKKVIVAKGLMELYAQFRVDPESYTCIPNGVSLEQIQSTQKDSRIWHQEFKIPEGDTVVLYVGHFYEWKGVYTLIDAAAFLPPRVSVVLIGGTKEDTTQVGGYIAKKGLPKVYLHDFMSQDAVIRFMRSADVLVLPNTSKEERSSLYTTPIKLFEYMASGVPIAASNIKSLRWYLRDRENSVLFTPDDPRDLARKITQLASDSELGSRIGKRAQEESQMYTWQERAKRILVFLGNTL